MVKIFRTRHSDPSATARTMVQRGERILTNRGEHRSSLAVGPACRIMAESGECRLMVVSQRDSMLGYDD